MSVVYRLSRPDLHRLEWDDVRTCKDFNLDLTHSQSGLLFLCLHFASSN